MKAPVGPDGRRRTNIKKSQIVKENVKQWRHLLDRMVPVIVTQTDVNVRQSDDQLWTQCFTIIFQVYIAAAAWLAWIVGCRSDNCCSWSDNKWTKAVLRWLLIAPKIARKQLQTPLISIKHSNPTPRILFSSSTFYFDVFLVFGDCDFEQIFKCATFHAVNCVGSEKTN